MNSTFPSFKALSEYMHNDMAPATLSFEVNKAFKLVQKQSHSQHEEKTHTVIWLHSVVQIKELLPSSEASERLTVPRRVQLPPLPLVCSADASAAFASISSLYIGTPRAPADSRTLFFPLSLAFTLHARCDCEKKHRWTSVLWLLWCKIGQ